MYLAYHGFVADMVVETGFADASASYDQGNIFPDGLYLQLSLVEDV